MLFQAYAILTMLLGLSLASTSWRWDLDEPIGDKGLDYIEFGWKFKISEALLFWYVAQQMTFIGRDHFKGTVYCGLQPQPDLDGKSQMRAVFSSFIDGSGPESPNCSPGADGGPGVSCAVTVNAHYSSMFSITVTPVEDSPNNIWHAMLRVEGNSYEIGRISLPENLTGMDNAQLGFIEDYRGHEKCTQKSPLLIDIYAPKSKWKSGTLSGFHETAHCPHEDPPQYSAFPDHYEVFKT